MRHLFPIAAAVLAASIATLAEDPPAETQKESEDRFDAFVRQWRSIGTHMVEGQQRVFSVEASGESVPVKGKLTVTAHNPDPESVTYDRKLELENRDQVAAAGVPLPPLLAARQWMEPPPLMFPEGGRTTLEKDVELKVGDKTLKCWKLAITGGPTGPAKGSTSAFWISEDEHMGLVRTEFANDQGRKLVIQLTSWTAPEK